MDGGAGHKAEVDHHIVHAVVEQPLEADTGLGLLAVQVVGSFGKSELSSGMAMSQAVEVHLSCMSRSGYKRESCQLLVRSLEVGCRKVAEVHCEGLGYSYARAAGTEIAGERQVVVVDQNWDQDPLATEQMEYLSQEIQDVDSCYPCLEQAQIAFAVVYVRASVLEAQGLDCART